MITLDVLRTALLSDQPYTRLDELVRTELSAGRLTHQLHDELYGLEHAVRATPGFGEDAEEALRDAIDALNGFAPARYVYKNPPVLPTEEEIAKVPNWARVAFGARCARRVLPLVRQVRPRTPQNTIKAATGAVEDSEIAASIATPSVPLSQKNASFFAHSYWENDPHDMVAAKAMSSILTAFRNAQQGDDLARAHLSAQYAVEAASQIAALTPVIRRDFDHLARLAQWQHWTDDTPVPPEVFGPLWPEGPPAGWPADPDVPQRTDLPIELLSRARVLERMTEDEAVNLFNTINAYYIARTGNRLTMEDLRPLIAAGVLAEV